MPQNASLDVPLSEVVDDPEEQLGPRDRGATAYDDHDPHPDWDRKRAESCPYPEESDGSSPTFSVLSRENARACLEHPDVVLADVYREHLETVMGKGMHTLDPPEHTEYRSRLKPLFQEAVGRRTSETLEACASRVLADLRGRKRIDLIDEYTSVVPFRVLSRTLGLPRGHHVWFRRTVRSFSRAFQKVQQDPAADGELQRVRDVLRSYFSDMVDLARGRTVTEGLIPALAHVREDGARLPEKMIASFLMHLAPAATDSTATAAGMTLYGLLTHRDQHDRLREDLSRVPAAVEEGLRWEAPFAVLDRKAAEPITLSGRRIQAGSRLLVHVGAANRDPDVFRRPHQFELDREHHRHLTFAAGPHLCLGRTLARRELQAMLRVLYRTFEDFRLDPQRRDQAYVGGTFWRSIPKLPVVVE